MLLLDGREAADTGPHDSADLVSIAVVHHKPGVLHGLIGGDKGELREPIHPARVLLADDGRGVETAHFTGETRRQSRRIEERDGIDAALAGGYVGPELRDGVAERRDGAEAGDDDAPLKAHAVC